MTSAHDTVNGAVPVGWPLLGRSGSRDLVVGFTDPDAIRVDADAGSWIAVGLDAGEVSALAGRGPDPAVAERLVRSHRNALILLVTMKDGMVESVGAWRGLLCGVELFYVVLGDGTAVFTDHFRNAIACLPLADRAPSDEALLEHYLTGWTYDRQTYASGVDRLAVGDRLRWNPASDMVTVDVFDRIVPTSNGLPLDLVPRKVEAALDETMAPLRGNPDVCAAFSGGVDSTLLATLLDEESPLVAATTDSPEFGQETEYARVAARLLGRELEEVRVEESDYLELLEDTVDRLATPAQFYVTPMLSVLYRRPESTFVIGEGADSIFGSGRGIRKVAAMFANRPGIAALRLLEGVPGTIGARAEQIRDYSVLYAEDPLSTSGQAGRALMFGDTEIVEQLVAADEIDRLVERHLAAVQDRVELELIDTHKFYAHLELHRWRHTNGDKAFLDRHLAHSYGKRVVLPYTSAPVVEELLRAPAKSRYVRRLSGKWVLKDILGRRLPGYGVNKRKLATGLPFERYYTDGPLTGIWDRYDVPDFIQPAIRESVVREPTATTWNAINHAVWSQRIERNPELRPLPMALELRMPLPPRDG